jgi:hypothetical protein
MAPKTERPRADRKTLVAFRFPPELLARLDAYAARLKADAPWSEPTRADAVRDLLVRGLDEAGIAPLSGASKRRPRA